MNLKYLSYNEYKNQSRYWELEEFQLGKINLIVGINASGKSRTLNVIYGLAQLILSTKVTFNAGTYDVILVDNKGLEYSYHLKISKGRVLKETLNTSTQKLFSRGDDGTGEMFNDDIKGFLKFKIPTNQLLVSRRDEIQFPYLEKLYFWAKDTKHFKFGRDEEKQTLELIGSNKLETEKSKLNNVNLSINTFKLGVTKYKLKFLDSIIKDFNSVGYDISKIDTGAMQSIKVNAPGQKSVVGLRVYEKDRTGFTDQHEMSDGMFRALAIIIQLNYYDLENKKASILIDDIGEGLDFERSNNLITLLIDKSIKQGGQLFMTTNDKFVMNKTSLGYWQVVNRKGGLVKMSNVFNSKELFEEFRFTGLNNFDFLTTDFLNTGSN